MEARWKRSSRSTGANNCVELVHTLSALRDSKNPTVALAVTPAAVNSLLRSLGR
jgi:Domain of unknown function (DUF397)